MNLLKPNLEQKVAEKQRRQQFDHDKHSRVCQFSDGENLFVKNQGRRETWLPGHIIESSGPVSLKVQLHDGRTISQHQDYLWKRFTKNNLNFLSVRWLGHCNRPLTSNMCGIRDVTFGVPRKACRGKISIAIYKNVAYVQTVAAFAYKGTTNCLDANLEF